MSVVDYVHGELGALGLRPHADWNRSIAAAIDACGAVSSAVNEDEYRARVLAEVASRVTVPETHFFRNHAQLAECSTHLLRRSAREGRPAKLWCAGSATGEEPYTIAMLVDRFDDRALEERVQITASDINPVAVAKAREAKYTSWSFRGAPGWAFSYFTPDVPGLVRLAPIPIRRAVRFEVESCQAGAAGRASGSLDVILFRNVAIYWEERAIRDLHDEFARLLRPGGLLALGPSDPRPTSSAFVLEGYYDDAPLFRRLEAVSAAARAPSPLRLVPPAPPVPVAITLAEPAARPSAPVRKSSVRSSLAPAGDDRATERAIGVAVSLTQGQPPDAIAHRIVGQMHLSRGEVDQAVAVLRQAVFLDGADVLARYFYALALREAADPRKASRQLAQCIDTLKSLPAGDLLSDQATHAAELLSAANFLEEQWS